MANFGYSPVPLVLAMILGPMLEKNFQRAMIISGDSYMIFLQSGISQVLVAMTFISLFYPYISPLLEKRRKKARSDVDLS